MSNKEAVAFSVSLCYTYYIPNSIKHIPVWFLSTLLPLRRVSWKWALWEEHNSLPDMLDLFEYIVYNILIKQIPVWFLYTLLPLRRISWKWLPTFSLLVVLSSMPKARMVWWNATSSEEKRLPSIILVTRTMLVVTTMLLCPTTMMSSIAKLSLFDV